MQKLVEGAMKDWRMKGASVPEGRLLCVFLDDLDRCSPANVFQVFEALKLYLDAKGLVFVIGYHPGIISEAILAKKDYASGVTAREYLKKIVQISYPISVPDEPQAKELLAAQLRESGTTTPFGDAEVRSLVIEHSARNPRRMKRFINNFILRYGLDAEWLEIGPSDLIRVQVLEMHFPEFVRLLAERSKRNPVDEFLEYVEVRHTLRHGDGARSGPKWERVVAAFAAQDQDRKPPDGSDEKVLDELEREVPEPFSKLVDDADFKALVSSLSQSTQRDKLYDKLARRSQTMEHDDAAALADDVPSLEAPIEADVLWIDDNPAANQGLVRIMKGRGASVTEVRSGDEARQILRGAPPDLLISDIARDGRPDAGFEDLALFRDDGYAGPAIFYAGRITPARRDLANAQDAQITAAPPSCSASRVGQRRGSARASR